MEKYCDKPILDIFVFIIYFFTFVHAHTNMLTNIFHNMDELYFLCKFVLYFESHTNIYIYIKFNILICYDFAIYRIFVLKTEKKN